MIEGLRIDVPVHSFQITIAEKNVQINCRYKKVLKLCRNYLSEFSVADFTVEASAEELVAEGEQLPPLESYGEAVAVSRCYDDLESFILQRKIADCLIESHIILFHGAAIAVDNKCFVFTAPSGTGKTTHIRNWLKKVPGTIVVNGDKPYINVDSLIVYGSPWCGKEGMNNNVAYPLAGIVKLERGEKNSIEPTGFHSIFPVLLNQAYSSDKNKLAVYRLIGKLKDVPFFILRCNMDEESADVACQGLMKYTS